MNYSTKEYSEFDAMAKKDVAAGKSPIEIMEAWNSTHPDIDVDTEIYYLKTLPLYYRCRPKSNVASL